MANIRRINRTVELFENYYYPVLVLHHYFGTRQLRQQTRKIVEITNNVR